MKLKLRVPFLVSAIILFPFISSFTQTKADTPNIQKQIPLGFEKKLYSHLTNVADQKLTIDKNKIDSLHNVNTSFTDSLILNFKNDYHTIYLISKDSLNVPRRDSLAHLYSNLTNLLVSPLDDWKKNTSKILREHSVKIYSFNQQLKNLNLKDENDYSYVLENQVEEIDNLDEIFIDKVLTSSDDLKDNIKDLHETVRDSLRSFYQTLVENEQYVKELMEERAEAVADSLENEKEIASKLIISAYYDNHLSYLSRDEGKSVSYFAPSIMYYHRSGFSFSVTIGMVADDRNKLIDEFDASLAYSLKLSDWFSADLSYSRYWFADSSIQAKSISSSSIECYLDFNFNQFDLAVGSGLDIGHSNAYSFIISPSYYWEIKNILGADRIVFQPEISGIFGMQSSRLSSIISQRVKKKLQVQTLTSDSKSFSVLGYEPSFSIGYEIGDFTFRPTFKYIIPYNVLDVSNSKPYMDFTIDVSFIIR